MEMLGGKRGLYRRFGAGGLVQLEGAFVLLFCSVLFCLLGTRVDDGRRGDGKRKEREIRLV